jgi:glycosyltransferase involved in cell wall biosynthesis
MLLGKRFLAALRKLLADMYECGVFSMVSWKLAYQFLAATKLAEILIQERCTHLHVHFADTPGQIAMYASAMTGVPFTIMAHANDIFQDGILLRQKAERAICLLTISKFNVDYLSGLGISNDRLAVVRCGVSFSTQPSSRRVRNNVSTRIGSLGRMVEKKGFDVLLASVARLREEGHLIELSLAGDGPLRPYLVEIIEQLNLSQCVQLEGSLAHDQVASWMQGLDVFVLACKRDSKGDMDGIPVVLMEAMSQSVPVVSCKLSGIPELVIHNQTGLLAEPDDPADLTRKIQRLIIEPDLGPSLASKALNFVNVEFAQSINVERLLSHFNFSALR